MNKMGGKRLPKGESSFKGFYRLYKYNAKAKKLEFTLTVETFREIITSPCFYCDREPTREHLHDKKTNGGFKCNGIDRVDNERGYTEENVVSCCTDCNWMKQQMSLEKFFNHIKNIFLNLKKKGLLKV